MDATDTYVPEPKAVTLESAVRIINFWRDRAIAAEAEAAELRERLATVADLVPASEWMEREGKPAATIEVTDGYCDPGNVSLPVGKWAIGSWTRIDIPHGSEDDGSEGEG